MSAPRRTSSATHLPRLTASPCSGGDLLDERDGFGFELRSGAVMQGRAVALRLVGKAGTARGKIAHRVRAHPTEASPRRELERRCHRREQRSSPCEPASGDFRAGRDDRKRPPPIAR